MITKINHIGIAVRSLDENIPFYKDVLKFRYEGIEEVLEQKVKVAIFSVGESRIELLESTSEDSPIAKFLEGKNEGLHHIAYQTDNIEKEIQHLTENEIKMIDTTPRRGAHNTKVAFIHPKCSGRVLTELCQQAENNLSD
jgi:methylmalonyl-CoA/ethylmalonyl-CoA epimerase